MKNWTFKTQIFIGIGILLCFFILATITKQGIFTNIAWVVYGLLFIVHPVYPGSQKWRYAGNTKKMNRDMRIAGAVVVLIGVLIRFGY